VTGLSEFSAAPTFKRAFYDSAVGLWPNTEVQVVYGQPGTYLADDVVAVTRVHAEQVPAAMGTNRSREETLTLTVIISVYRGGGEEVEVIASDRAYELLGQLERFVRVTDTTVRGTVRECFLDEHDSDGETRPELIASGRTIEIEAKFTAHARVTRL